MGFILTLSLGPLSAIITRLPDPHPSITRLVYPLRLIGWGCPENVRPNRANQLKVLLSLPSATATADMPRGVATGDDDSPDHFMGI